MQILSYGKCMHCPVQGNSKSILGFVNFLYWILWTTSDTAQRSSFEMFERRLAEGLVSVMKRSWIT